MTEETLEEKLAAVRENLATEWCLRTVAEQEVKRQRERIAELERQLATEREARLRTEAACAALREWGAQAADTLDVLSATVGPELGQLCTKLASEYKALNWLEEPQ